MERWVARSCGVDALAGGNSAADSAGRYWRTQTFLSRECGGRNASVECLHTECFEKQTGVDVVQWLSNTEDDFAAQHLFESVNNLNPKS